MFHMVSDKGVMPNTRTCRRGVFTYELGVICVEKGINYEPFEYAPQMTIQLVHLFIKMVGLQLVTLNTPYDLLSCRSRPGMTKCQANGDHAHLYMVDNLERETLDILRIVKFHPNDNQKNCIQLFYFVVKKDI